jgi:glucosylceramidase
MRKSCVVSLMLLLAILQCICIIQNEAAAQSSKSFKAEKATVYVTARDSSLRLTRTGGVAFEEFLQPLETQPCVFVDPTVTFQTMIGIGGAITDASAETFSKLPDSTQKEFITAYFDNEKGIGYNLARTNIASCDFSSGSYSYVEENDSLLKTFSVAHDEQFRIPLIKKARAAADGNLLLFASPWSPPAWMKDNNNVSHGGKLLEKFKQAWANHFIKFIQAYETHGIPVWGFSVQNEPMAIQRWESCIFTAEEERDFIKKYLGPTMYKNDFQDKKLIAWDHNRDLVYQRASVLLGDPDAAKYIWGIGFHWYETWTKSAMQFGNIKLVHEAFPNKNLIFTEGCIENFSMERLNDWALGEKYGNSIVNDLNCGSVGWTDWNILLDETGGPNHVGNFCFAPIHGDTRTGKLIYTNTYYYIGHFSKFIHPGAKRIVSSSNRDKLQTIAFLNPDGKIAVVVLNTSDENISYKLWLAGRATNLESLSHSIATIIL